MNPESARTKKLLMHKDEIRRLIGDLGRERTVLLSTHVLPEVQFTCSRLLIISGGRIVADGPVDQLIARAEGASRVAVEAAGNGVADRLAGLYRSLGASG